MISLGEMNRIQQTMRQDMSDVDIRLYLSEPIMKYSEFSKVQDIGEILKKSGDYRIVLLEEKKNDGHFCCIFRYKLPNKKPTIVWWDSYGDGIDKELKFIPEWLRRQLGENTPFLSKLLKDWVAKGGRVEWNHHRYQKLWTKSACCGRFCVVRLKCLQCGYYTEEDFFQFMKRYEKKFGLNSEQLVCFWIPA